MNGQSSQFLADAYAAGKASRNPRIAVSINTGRPSASGCPRPGSGCRAASGSGARTSRGTAAPASASWSRSYLGRHGRPAAFYSDKHSIFRVARADSAGRANGVTQFGRALAALNIDIICANSPQAKGRVERMNKTLQDRLVKELRLLGISSMADGNAFLPTFMAEHNRRFGRPPRDPHDAHRPLRGDEDLAQIFSWQEDRRMTANLTLRFKCRAYHVTPGAETQPLAGKMVRVHEWENGRVELRCEGRLLPYSIFDKNPIVTRGAIVENKRLGAVLAVIQASQTLRDQARLASRKLSLRDKERLRAARARAGTPNAEARPTTPNRTFLLGRQADISTWV